MSRFRWSEAVRHDESLTDGDAGYSLLEVMISFVLFLTVAGGATWGIVSALNASHLSQQRVDAGNVAQSWIADAQANAATIHQESNVSYTAGVAHEQFAVLRTISFNTPGATQCSTGATFTVNVVVSQQQTGKFLARSDSVISCPAR